MGGLFNNYPAKSRGISSDTWPTRPEAESAESAKYQTIFHAISQDNCFITRLILQAKKFLKCDWLRPVVFLPNLKYLHVKISVSMET